MMELTESDKKRLARSGYLAGAFWLALTLALFLVPMPVRNRTPREFTSVRLTLNAEIPASAPSVEPVDLAAAADASAGSAPAQKPLTAKTAKKAAAAAKKKAASGPASAAPSSGLGIPNFASPVTSSNEASGAPEYLDFSSASPTANPRSASVPPGGAVTEFEGAAASLGSGAGDSGPVKSSSRDRTPASGAVSEGTAQALTRIAGQAGNLSPSSALSQNGNAATAESSGTAGSAGSLSGTPSAASLSSSVGGITFAGAARKLLYPAEPSIVLPERLARLVDSDRAVTIQFTVLPDGTVPGTLVLFTPSAVLPAEIRDYLRGEFSRWRFERGTEDGHARFLYSIKMQ